MYGYSCLSLGFEAFSGSSGKSYMRLPPFTASAQNENIGIHLQQFSAFCISTVLSASAQTNSKCKTGKDESEKR